MNKKSIEQSQINQIVQIAVNGIQLEGALVIPQGGSGCRPVCSWQRQQPP